MSRKDVWDTATEGTRRWTDCHIHVGYTKKKRKRKK